MKEIYVRVRTATCNERVRGREGDSDKAFEVWRATERFL